VSKTLRGAKHFPSTSYFFSFCLVCTVKRNSPVVESCFSVGLILEPREGWIVTSSMLNARQIGQRELLLPCAWKSLITVACLVFPFSLLWPSLLICIGRASVTATSLSFLESFGLPTIFSLNYLANWYQESSQVLWRACHASLGFGTLNLCLYIFFLLLFPCDARHPSQLLKEVPLIQRHWSGTPWLLSPASVWDWCSNLRKDGLWRHRC